MSRRDGDVMIPNPYQGILPVLPSPDFLPDKDPRKNAATGASAASIRALTSQAVAFYFRAPVKAFFRTRVDYLAYARSVHQAQTDFLAQAAKAAAAGGPVSRIAPWLTQARLLLRNTTPYVLSSVIQSHGWSVIHEQILPPLIANVGVGVVLYTSYLQILGRLHEESSKAAKRVYPPPDPLDTFAAGFLAGSIQSVVAAPLDAIQARYDHHDLIEAGRAKGNVNSRPQSMWTFSAQKLREIGLRGIFAGWGLSFLKDSFGSAIFFSTFEFIKAQGYYNFVTWYYGGLSQDIVNTIATRRGPGKGKNPQEHDGFSVITPHYSIEPIFLLLAGVTASFAQQIVLHPLSHIQVKHWDHLEDLDLKAQRQREREISDETQQQRRQNRWKMVRAYYHAYQETIADCRAEANAETKSFRKWLFRGFWWNTIRQVPSTSAGLIIFELVRRKYGLHGDRVRINKDGYDILLD